MQAVAISDLNPGQNPELVTQSTTCAIKKRFSIMHNGEAWFREKNRECVDVCV